ncbi:MAG: hypothetical protein NTU62_06840 [Spirochaetes bacterium]|nr:hypothetical protein [Spirochaetota bacterium]
MPPDRYQVLLNDSLKRHVLGLEPGERRRLREKFEFLENGLWDTGVRVKKLKGVASRVVFEARASRGDRLLFTLGRHRGRTAIYVWALVAHDDIGHAARRVSPADAPFLDFASESEEDLPDLALDAAPPGWVSQEDVDEKVPEDYGPQRWLVLDDAEWERILRSPSADPFELYLFLTHEQAEILETDPPVLLSGTAGSGKTTLSVYYLLRSRTPGDRRLFLTFNEGLRRLCEGIYRGLVAEREEPGEPPTFALFRGLLADLAQPFAARFPAGGEVGLREFRALFHNHPDHRRYDAELVWEEIRSIIKGAKLPLNPGRLETLANGLVSGALRPRERAELAESLLGLEHLAVASRIERFLGNRTAFGTLRGLLSAMEAPRAADPRQFAPALEEIVRAVRHADADVSRPLLSLEEYLALGKKRAPTFRWDRHKLHAIATWYQDRLASTGGWDELDLCRAALQRLASDPDAPSWDLVVCDEAQDFTDLQLSLVFRIVRDPRRVVITADPRQIVNPSGFRWEEVKNRFFERGLPVPEVRRLSLNFRCVGSIVRLANALLEVKQNLVGLADTEMREQWKFSGKPPVLVHGLAEDEVLGSVSAKAAGQALLVRDEAERDSLKRKLGTELVFTIREAKGLEFDSVLLWKFADAPEAAGLWRRIRVAEIDTAEHAAKVRYELALLYVAVTRARNTLLIYDGVEASEVWDVEAISGLVVRSREAARLAELWRTASSPADWERQGDYLLERDHHAAALECYRNAGREDKAEQAQARVFEADGRYAEAAPLFERHGMIASAAASWEKANRWTEAASAWGAVGDADRADLCSIRSCEAAGKWRAAAEGWERRKEPDLAVAAWEKAGDFERVAEHWFSRKEYEKALKFFDRARRPLRSAACLVKLKRPGEAADRYFQAGEYGLAVPLYKKAKNDERLAACFKQLKDWKSLALVHERRGEAAEAVAVLRRWLAEDGTRRQELESEAGDPVGRRSALHVAIRRAVLADAAGAAPLFLKAGKVDLALKLFEETGDQTGLAECLAALERYDEAARAIEQSQLPPAEKESKARECLKLHLIIGKGRQLHVREALHDEADRLLAAGKPVEALARYQVLDDAEGECSAWLRLDRDEEAVTRFLSSGGLAQARRMLRERPLRLSAGFFDRLIGMAADERAFDEDEIGGFVSLFADLLAASLPGLAAQDASAIVDRFVRAAYGPYPFERGLPDRLLDLMLETRAYRSLVAVLGLARPFGPEITRRLLAYLDRIRDAAAGSSDPVLAACHALVADPDRFEQLAADLPLNASTATLVGWSTPRYPEAVGWLLQAGRFGDAEEVCRTNHDFRMAGAVLERAGDPRRAARTYAQARHYSEALRLYRKLGDQRAVERMRKKMKEAPPGRKGVQPESRQPLLPGLGPDSPPSEAPQEKPHESGKR